MRQERQAFLVADVRQHADREPFPLHLDGRSAHLQVQGADGIVESHAAVASHPVAADRCLQQRVDGTARLALTGRAAAVGTRFGVAASEQLPRPLAPYLVGRQWKQLE